MRDFGWVYKTPHQPPAMCSCGRRHVVIGSVVACPHCDDAVLFPRVKREGLGNG